jgi:hypothetical protein
MHRASWIVLVTLAVAAKPAVSDDIATDTPTTGPDCSAIVVANPRALFAALGIAVSNMGRPDPDDVRAYIESRYMDGTISEAQKQELHALIARGSRVMNPSSRGAGQIARATAAALRCYGLDTLGTGTRPPDAPARSSDPLLLAKKHAKDDRIALYTYHLNAIGNADGDFAPILVLADGSALIVGTKSVIPPGGAYRAGASRPVAVKLDPTGKVAWERDLRKRGFKDYEGGSAAVTADGGFAVFVLSYPNPGGGAVSRFVKLDRKGKRKWERQLRGKGGNDTPFPSMRVRMLPSGSIELAGHVYLPIPNGGGRAGHAWSGEIDARGKVVADVTGAADPKFGGTRYGGATYGGATRRSDPLSTRR